MKRTTQLQRTIEERHSSIELHQELVTARDDTDEASKKINAPIPTCSAASTDTSANSGANTTSSSITLITPRPNSICMR
jgi:hypothetical protein